MTHTPGLDHDCCPPGPGEGHCICVDGVIDLGSLGALYADTIAALGHGPLIPCPRCRASEWPDGFPGVKAQPAGMFDHWLIPRTA